MPLVRRWSGGRLSRTSYERLGTSERPLGRHLVEGGRGQVPALRQSGHVLFPLSHERFTHVMIAGIMGGLQFPDENCIVLRNKAHFYQFMPRAVGVSLMAVDFLQQGSSIAASTRIAATAIAGVRLDASDGDVSHSLIEHALFAHFRETGDRQESHCVTLCLLCVVSIAGNFSVSTDFPQSAVQCVRQLDRFRITAQGRTRAGKQHVFITIISVGRAVRETTGCPAIPTARVIACQVH